MLYVGYRRHTGTELDGVCVGPRVRTIVLRGIQEEEEAGERLLSQLGMSEYYGSEGFDHPPSDVYVLVWRRLFRPAMTGLGRECLGPGREPLSPWGLCLCVLA